MSVEGAGHVMGNPLPRLDNGVPFLLDLQCRTDYTALVANVRC